MKKQFQFSQRRRTRGPTTAAFALLLSNLNAVQAFTLQVQAPLIPLSSSSSLSLSSSTPPSSSVLFSSNRNINNDKYDSTSDKAARQCKGDETVNTNANVIDTSRRNTLLKALSIPSGMMFLSTKPSYADIEGVVSPSFLNDPNVNAVPVIEPPTSPSSLSSSSSSSPSSLVTVYKTRSGLQYVELEKGTGPSPKYGNFVTISYKAYVKLPKNSKQLDSSLQEYDSDASYLVKHGNGRMIPGLDEGLHTMKVGGRRRIIIPPKLGYVGPGVLGPLPDSPYGRYRLNKLLDSMVEVRGGNVIFDVELRSVVQDEADQGYYEDDSLTPEQFNTLRVNIQQQAQAAKAQGIGNGFDLLDEI